MSESKCTEPVARNSVKYDDILALAPMVRCGTLPLRLLALRHGADVVWSEELIALKLGKCIRRVHEDTGIVGFYNPPRTINGGCDGDHYPVLLISPEELGKNVVQIGAATGPTAVEATTVVANDIAGIDVNMGCPKHFSTQGEMGSALLSVPEKAADIMKHLSRNFGNDIKVSCKIRLLPTLHATIEFAKTMVAAGAQAITVHARTKLENAKDMAHWDVFPLLREHIPADIPLIANGDVFTVADYQHVKTTTACKGGPLEHPADMIAEYLQIAMSLEHGFSNTKYTIQTMVKEAGFVSEDAMFAYVVVDTSRANHRLFLHYWYHMCRSKSFDDMKGWCDDWRSRMTAAGIRDNMRLRSAFGRGVKAPFIEVVSGQKRKAHDAGLPPIDKERKDDTCT